MSELYVGRVIAVHQHDNSLDIQLSYDDSMLTGVPLMGPMMTTSSGLVDMHQPEGNTRGGPGSKTRDCFVIVARTSSGFIALGFISPQVNQMAFNRKNFKVDRHASDVYSTIDADGNMETAHPSGTFVRVATSPAHEDLTGKDFDKLWSVTRNKDKPVWLSVQVANTGGVKATFQIDPSGNVSLTHSGSLTINTSGSATMTAATMTINAPTRINGNTTINGTTTMLGSASVASGLAVTGAMTDNGANIGSSHTHGGVTPGPASTAAPN